MTEVNTSSSSFDKTEPSKPWIEVARLGQRIVHELNIDKDFSVLQRWTAHRIAELIQRVETAADDPTRELAAKECEELIIKLWAQRDSWPSGGPLASILPTLRRLLGKPDNYYRTSWNQKDDTSGIIGKLIKLHEQEMRLFLNSPNLAISKEIIEESQEKLTLFINDLTEDEKEVLLFTARNKFQDQDINDDFEPSSEDLENIIEKTKNSFEKIARERNKLIQKLSKL